MPASASSPVPPRESTPASMLTPLSAPASVAAIISAQTSEVASTPVLTPTSTLSSETTVSNLSVSAYLAQQLQKRAKPAKAVIHTTVLEGSAILATDDIMPVDYESNPEDGAVVEDEILTSSEKKNSEPSVGSHRPREDNSDASPRKRPRSEIEVPPSTSEAPVTPRSEPPVSDNWMPSARG
ncbi:Hypothetical protein PHPALM_17310 [Phytophthora palmivora]|uniref:Uncharacterized protein n=1 Tax=Phytophthora palmivora TaxID=4796 RepID=A0A2P4XMK1_9STRA|nr:Hypothetical protein PHPALM_17310 [Phytophthora palmivora]